MPDTSVTEDSGPIANYRDLNDVFSDIEDGTALTFTVTSSDPALVAATLDASDSTLDMTLGADQSGTATITVRATDAGSSFIEDQFDVVVTGDNDPPTVVSALPDTSVTEDSGPIANYRDLNDVFSDIEDGTALTFTVTSSDPTLVAATLDASDSTLDMTLGADQSGICHDHRASNG